MTNRGGAEKDIYAVGWEPSGAPGECDPQNRVRSMRRRVNGEPGEMFVLLSALT